MNAKNIWVTVLVIVLAGSIVTMFAVGTRRDEPGPSLTYDVDTLAKFNKVDPALVKFREVGKIQTGLTDTGALAVGPDGRVYVAGKNQIAVFDRDGTRMNLIPVDGVPECLAVAPDGEVLVSMRDHIDLIPADKSQKSSWTDFGPKTYITSIVANEKEVFVADAGNRIVLRFDRDGTLLGRIGKKDPNRDVPGFIVPSPHFDVAFDDQGALWVVDPGRHGLEEYRDNGDFVTSWYKASMDVTGFCGCCNPVYIAFRSDGSVVTAEKGLVRVKLYDVEGNFKGLVAPLDLFPDSAAALNVCSLGLPIGGLAVDPDDRVLVLDSRDNVVRIFEEKKTS